MFLANFYHYWFFIACGKYSVMYKYFFELPLLGDIRAPIKLLDNIQIGIGILGGFGFHSFSQQKEINSKNIKWLTIVLFYFFSINTLRLLECVTF